MGASTTIAHAVLTIAALAIAASFAFAIILKTGSLTSSISQLIFSQSNELRTDITIIDVYYSSTNSSFIIYVKNTGSLDISSTSLQQTDVYLGTYGGELKLYTYSATGGGGKWNYTETDASTTGWSSGETIVIRVYNTTSVSTPYQVKIILPNGEGEEYVSGG